MPSANMYFGFWLPHGIGNDVSEIELATVIGECYRHFDHIERVYKAFFSIPDDRL